MKKYWKIEGQDGLWVHDGEAANYRRFRQGDIAITLPLPSHCLHRPASFEEIHGRVKPPEIYGDAWAKYDYNKHNRKVVTVCRVRGVPVWRVDQANNFLDIFPTHAEAIAYAQKHAHESGGEISGA